MQLSIFQKGNNMSSFREYARYYDLFYSNKDYATEAKSVSDLIKKYQTSNDNKLLVAGCGTGRHDREFYKLGYKDIYAIDLSEDMIRIAREHAFDGMNYSVADIRMFECDKHFDCAVSLFHVISYQRSNEDIKNAFKCISRALTRGGVLVFDIWYGPGVIRDLPSVRYRELEDEKYTFQRVATPDLFPNENSVDVNYHISVIDKENNTVQKIEEKHQMRYFFKPEIEEYLNQAGFELLECVDCNTYSTPDFNSWTAYFICRKVN